MATTGAALDSATSVDHRSEDAKAIDRAVWQWLGALLTGWDHVTGIERDLHYVEIARWQS